MSAPNSKPRAGVYDVLLVLALTALLVGILFLWLQLGNYGYQTAPG